MSEQLKNCLPMDISALPPAAQLLVSLIGLHATTALIEKHGGKTLELAKRGDSQSNLAAVIGMPEVEKLYSHFGCCPISIPRCTSLLRNARNIKIHAMYDHLTGEGKTGRSAVHQIVEVFGVTERQVWRILKKTTLSLSGTTPLPVAA